MSHTSSSKKSFPAIPPPGETMAIEKELEVARSQYERLLNQFEVLASAYEDSLDDLERYRLFASMLESRLVAADRKVETAKKIQNEFLDTISHELLTPLNGILGMARLLNDIPLPLEAKESIDVITSCGENLEDILKSLLDYIHLSKGEIEFVTSSFDPIFTIESLIQQYVSTIYQKGLEITYIPSHGSYDVIELDKDRFQQILHTLLSNAIKFTPSGHITIESKIVNQPSKSFASQTNYELHLSVTDTGIGISSKDLKHIFRPFEQLDSSNNRNFGGVGIGLSLAKEIITQMEGAIVIDSEPGKGSTFMVTLPLQGVHLSPRLGENKTRFGAKLTVSSLHTSSKNLLTNLLSTLDVDHAFTDAETEQHHSPDHQTVWLIDYPSDTLKSKLYDSKILSSHANYAHIIAFVPPGSQINPQIKNLFDVIMPKPISMHALQGGLDLSASLMLESSPDSRMHVEQRGHANKAASEKVLLVESNLINKKILLHLLGMLSLDVDSVTSLDEMKSRITSTSYSHIVINPAIDPTSNLSLIYLVLNTANLIDNARVVAITGKDSAYEEEQLQEAGFDSHLTLPARLGDFAEALQVNHK